MLKFLCPYTIIEGRCVQARLDTGADISVVSAAFAEELKLPRERWRYDQRTVRDISGRTLWLKGKLQLKLELCGVATEVEFGVVSGLATRVVIGVDLMDRLGLVMNFQTGELTARAKGRQGTVQRDQMEELIGLTEAGAEEKQELRKLLEKFSPLFREKGGCTSVIEHRIETDGAPVFRGPYGFTREKQETAEELVQEMLADGVIEEASSPWCSPVLLVKKKTGDQRFCVDYRLVNKITKDDRFPIPLIPSLLNKMGDSTYFSSLDLAAGYWQVRLAPEHREKTAFIVGTKMYQFRVMPFGLKGAPATFSRLMQRVLKDVLGKSCEVYLDDIIVHSASFSQHLKDLEEVFKALDSAGLTLKPQKCRLVQTTVEFLGFEISKGQLLTQPGKIEAVKAFPKPKTSRQVKQFLGLCGWYHQFVPGFSSLAEPLYGLTRKSRRWQWTEECQEAFEGLKEKLCQAPILGLPREGWRLFLYTDASATGLGAVLHQHSPEGEVQVLAYASRLLQGAEINYSVTEKECLAVIWALEKFRMMLTRELITVVTDHSALSWLQTARNLKGRLYRWAVRLQEFNFVVEHRKGTRMEAPDALSRNTSLVEENDHSEERLEHRLYALFSGVGKSELIDEQLQDSDLGPLVAYLKSGTLPFDPQMASQDSHHIS